ncbi:MAG: hypothetical protein LBG73_09635 [Spirochaetaceae bacterium]|jgi:hypothetical protein|nr:hypothetical protein [Spirochaetaceae bacterium]
MDTVIKKPALAVIIKRAVAFLGGICFFIVFLYAIGTKQGFMDITQLLLLHWAIRMGVFLGVISCFGIFLDCWMLFHKQFQYVRSLIAYMVFGLLGFGCAFSAAFVVALTGGNEA